MGTEIPPEGRLSSKPVARDGLEEGIVRDDVALVGRERVDGGGIAEGPERPVGGRRLAIVE